MRRLRQRYPTQLAVIGVHSAKFPSEGLTENIRQAAVRHDIQHPVVNDAGFAVWNQYAVRAWPTLILIDPQGRIVHSESGEIDAEVWIERIEAVLSAANISPAEGRTAEAATTEMTNEGTAEAVTTNLSFSSSSPPPASILSYPSRLLLTPDGSLYVADTGHHRLLELRLDPDGMGAEIRRVFGSGDAGFRDGPAEQAAFHHPRGLAWYGATLYVADSENHSVRAIDLLSGQVRTLAGTGRKGTGRPAGEAPTEIDLRSPWALLALPGGAPTDPPAVFIAMAGSHQIWALLPDGRLGVFAGNGREALVDGPLHQASFNQPSDLALGLGHLFVADAEASAVRAIDLSAEPKVLTLVGMGLFEFGDVDGARSAARLQHPAGLAFARQEPAQGEAVGGLVYIADSYNHKIKSLDPYTGRVETLIGAGQPGSADGPFAEAGLWEPEGVLAAGDKLYIADTNNHLIRVADLTSRRLHTLALRGMERLPARPGTAARGLEPLLVAPGRAELTFNLRLPAGYKLNPQAPITLRLAWDGAVQTHSFRPGQPLALPLETDRDGEALLDWTVYYCQEQDARLCLIADRRLSLPIRVAPGAPAAARLEIQIEASDLA